MICIGDQPTLAALPPGAERSRPRDGGGGWPRASPSVRSRSNAPAANCKASRLLSMQPAQRVPICQRPNKEDVCLPGETDSATCSGRAGHLTGTASRRPQNTTSSRPTVQVTGVAMLQRARHTGLLHICRCAGFDCSAEQRSAPAHTRAAYSTAAFRASALLTHRPETGRETGDQPNQKGRLSRSRISDEQAASCTERSRRELPTQQATDQGGLRTLMCPFAWRLAPSPPSR